MYKLLIGVSVDTVSLVLVGVARLHCCDVFWDNYQFTQDMFSSWADPQGPGDTLCPEKTSDTCHRCATIEINFLLLILQETALVYDFTMLEMMYYFGLFYRMNMHYTKKRTEFLMQLLNIPSINRKCNLMRFVILFSEMSTFWLSQSSLIISHTLFGVLLTIFYASL